MNIDDPYYIPSVPQYKPLGEDLDDTIGDKFFEQNFFAPSPVVIRKPVSSSSSMRLRSSSSSGLLYAPLPPPPEITNGVAPIRPRRSRSLLKPGRPSVESVISGKAAAELPASAFLMKPVNNDATGGRVLKSSVSTVNKISADKNYTSAHATSSMRLRSSSISGPLRVPAPPPLKTINAALPIQPRRSRSLLKPGRPSIESVISTKVAAEPPTSAPLEKPGNNKTAERLLHASPPPLSEITNGVAPIRPRRSRSLLKPGRPSVESVILKKAVAEPSASESFKKSVNNDTKGGLVSTSSTASSKAAASTDKIIAKRRPSYLAPTYSSKQKSSGR